MANHNCGIAMCTGASPAACIKYDLVCGIDACTADRTKTSEVVALRVRTYVWKPGRFKPALVDWTNDKLHSKHLNTAKRSREAKRERGLAIYGSVSTFKLISSSPRIGNAPMTWLQFTGVPRSIKCRPLPHNTYVYAAGNEGKPNIEDAVSQ